MYLLEMASGVERDTFWAGDLLTLEPGQLVTGRKKISMATGVPETTVERYLNILEKLGQIGQQKTSVSRLITITNWNEYQSSGQQMDNKRTTNGQRTDTNKEVKRRLKNDRFREPTLEEVKAYCLERQNSVDPESFIDYYSSKGWMVGKNKMKDWRAALRRWEKNDHGGSSWRRA
jgi:DNA replication protein DnaD